MPRLILKANYLKNTPKKNAKGYLTYIATRDGVEKIPEHKENNPASYNQKKLIQKLTKEFKDCKEFHEYQDYINNPTIKTASDFITIALESNITKADQYMNYIATRKGVARTGSHGLFSDYNIPSLNEAKHKIAKHQGYIWTFIISLKREDAERLGYNNANSFKNLTKQQRNTIAEVLNIPTDKLKWYGAYHNSGHHPHMHLVVYSNDPTKGYLNKQGIQKLRSKFANQIFKQDLIQLYAEKTDLRNELRDTSREAMKKLIDQLGTGVYENHRIEQLMQELSQKLKNTKGKKQYGYLREPLRYLVNQIVDELGNMEDVKQCYEKWCKVQNNIISTYKDTPEQLPLSKQKEFKHIKNIVIKEAIQMASITQNQHNQKPMEDAIATDENSYINEHHHSQSIGGDGYHNRNLDSAPDNFSQQNKKVKKQHKDINHNLTHMTTRLVYHISKLFMESLPPNDCGIKADTKQKQKITEKKKALGQKSSHQTIH